MKRSVKQFLQRFRREAKRRPNRVETKAMGRLRRFRAYDLGDDTFVFEKGVWMNLNAHASVLIVAKRDLRHNGGPGFVMTVTTGNHSVAALPLLQGLFWDLCRVKAQNRGEVMMHCILCANVVEGRLEVSQRDVNVQRLALIDAWLVGRLGFDLSDVIMIDRTDDALEHFRRRGQEWRVRPLAWTEDEMKMALAASRKRISSSIRYYHASRGVHFLSYSGFRALGVLAMEDFKAFYEGLRELTSVFEGHSESFLRQNKYHGHHEIELFGLKRGVAIQKIVPELEKLMEQIVLKRISNAGAAARFVEVADIYRSLLTRPELADENSPEFVSLLYMHLTGEIYSLLSEGTTPAFDDRRTALPGATFVDGRPHFHSTTDSRSEVLLANIRALVSKDEYVEYANVYELRTNDADANLPIGEGATREIVYKTNRNPLVASLVEKRLSRTGRIYGSYVIARAQAFKSLGADLPDYRLLRHRARERGSAINYFIRTRCDGEPLADIPANYFQLAGEFGGADAGEDPQVVRALAALTGEAAAQNLVMKKYLPDQKSCLFGVGKEIYRFGFDVGTSRLMPQSVSCCSMRGALGWPDTSHTDRNLEAVARFYLPVFASSLLEFAARHPVCQLQELGESFFAGFEHRLRAMEWRYTVQRDEFEEFDPGLPPRFGFMPRWHFALWALERHVRRLANLRQKFFEWLENPSAAIAEAPDQGSDGIEDANAANVISALEEIELRFE